MNDIKLHPKFKPLWQTNKRYVVLTGGRAAMKSFTASLYLLTKTYDDAFGGLFTRYTMTSAERSIVPELKEKIELINAQNDFHITSSEVVNKSNNNRILFSGIKTSSGDQTANLKGLNWVTHFIVDEAEEFRDEEKFNTIDLSYRKKGVDIKVIIILNPTDTEHWIYKRWIQSTHRIENIDGAEVEISTHPEVEHIHTTYLDNVKNLNESWLKAAYAAKAKDFDYYAHIFLGAWTNFGAGAVLPKVKLKTFKIAELTKVEGKFVHIDVADEGTDYLAAILGEVSDGFLNITDVIYTQENTDVTRPLVVGWLNENSPEYVSIESNNMGAQFARDIKKDYYKGSVYSIFENKNKHAKILVNASFVIGNVRFLHTSEQSEDYKKFFSEVVNYNQNPEKNKGRPDDGTDALVGCASLARKKFNHIFT